MTVSELIEELVRFPQDSNENLEVWVGINCLAKRIKNVKRQSVFDADGSNQRTVAMFVLEKDEA